MSAPSDIPEVSAFVCLYDLPKPPTPAFDRLFAQMESRLLSLRETPARDDEFGMAELLVGESMGHIMRRIACFESDVVVQRQTFEKAYSVYEGVILALCHSSLNESLHSIRKGPKKAIIFQPFEGLETYTPDARRLISHCFAGMAICILMSERSTTVRTHVVDGKIIERNCAACGVWDRTGDNHRRCNACKLVYYCGKECQKAHWKLHKSVCNK